MTPLGRSAVAAVAVAVLSACSTLTVSVPLVSRDVAPDKALVTGTLKVLTLNVAHGRKTGFSQLLESGNTIHSNLVEVAHLLAGSDADVVALQEADGPSRWSGGFDHVAFLAKEANYAWYCRMPHAQSWLYDYGTALLSRGIFYDGVGHTFKPTPPTTTKGFLLGQVAWQPSEDTQATFLVDIISVHLDFSRRSVREQQIAEMAEALSGRARPMIVLGDFNSEWLDSDSIIRELAEKAGLRGYLPQAENLGTYNRGKRRYDWILISKDLEFTAYEVLPDVLSDHLAVQAEIRLNPNNTLEQIDLNELPRYVPRCTGDAVCNSCIAEP